MMTLKEFLLIHIISTEVTRLNDYQDDHNKGILAGLDTVTKMIKEILEMEESVEAS